MTLLSLQKLHLIPEFNWLFCANINRFIDFLNRACQKVLQMKKNPNLWIISKNYHFYCDLNQYVKVF